ncbi:ABC transporter permease [Paradesulfitobacterium ferrireducens]|uniref:ABC transporter permease n=1 Tax=Paradesulfitobacterium ferrireducens TaxID=2816476 RepID=UPI0038B26530
MDKYRSQGLSLSGIRRNFPAFILLILVLLLWEIVVKGLKVPLWLLPAPSQVGKALWQTRHLLLQHTFTTVLETTAGFGLAVAAGILTGLLMGIFPSVKRLFYPFLIISQTIPLIAVAPLLILWLGYGLLPKIITVILVCYFPVTISLLEGLEASDPDYTRLLRSMGASRWQILRLVRWPHALPSLFAGLKIAATYSVMGAVIGEWLGASSGLGVYLTNSSHSFLTDRVFAAIFTITVLSFVYFLVISLLGRLALPWLKIEK